MKNCITVILVAAVMAFWACTDEMTETLLKDTVKTDSVVVYTIPPGSHYSKESSFQALNVSEIQFKARFDSSAIYQTLDSHNQGDINKLYGMSDCNSNHQINSARFGWRWFENALQVWAYTYVNAERKIAFIKTVPLNSTNTYELTFTDSTYTFKINESAVSLPRHCSEKATGYKLYPYDEVAPHKITIQIQDIK